MRLPIVATFVLCWCASTLSPAIAADQKPASVAGKWNVTIRLTGRTASEQWDIQQKGRAITGTTKTDHGELPVSGTIEGGFFRVTIKDGEKQYKVRATVDGDAMDGSVTLGVGDSHLWFAKRAASTK